MRAYKDTKMICNVRNDDDIEDRLRPELTDGWVIIGIEQQRRVLSDGIGFDDVTHYILGQKDEEDEE
jgi:hypothetical protein